MQNEHNSRINSKAHQTVSKNNNLLEQKKYYEFAQKIKLLSHRKQQSSKYDESIELLQLGAARLLQIPDCDLNISNDLIQTLLDLYLKHKELWTSDSEKFFIQLMHVRDNQKIIEFYTFILKKVSNIKNCPDIGDQLVGIYIQKKEFVKAQAHIISMELHKVEKFLLCWKNEVKEEQFYAICCRIALLRGLFANFDEAMVILTQVPTHNPFYKFSRFLILSIQLKSKESYEKLETCYRAFLEKDEVYRKIYKTYGIYFFKKEADSGKGLGGLLSIFDS